MSNASNELRRGERALLRFLNAASLIWILLAVFAWAVTSIVAFMPSFGALVQFRIPDYEASNLLGVDSAVFSEAPGFDGELMMPNLPIPTLLVYVLGLALQFLGTIAIAWGIHRLTARMLNGVVFHQSIGNSFGTIAIGIALGILGGAVRDFVSVLALSHLPEDTPLAATMGVSFNDLALLLVVGAVAIAFRIGRRVQDDVDGLV